MSGTIHELSPSMQDYLKVLYVLEERAERLTNSAVAAALRIAPASVSIMMKKLAEKGCVTYSPYHDIGLTEKGRRVALEVIRHHRILESFLVTVLGMSWDAVHDEAERLEHVISEELEARMAALMHDPQFDPHGHPIPGPEGELASRSALVAMDGLAQGDAAVVREVSDEDPEALRYLGEQGLFPGVRFTLGRVHPFDGPFELALEGGRPVILSRALARRLTVQQEKLENAKNAT